MQGAFCQGGDHAGVAANAERSQKLSHCRRTRTGVRGFCKATWKVCASAGDRPIIWPGWSKVNVKPSRLLGILVTGILLALAASLCRSSMPGTGSIEPSRPVRGGQLVAAIRSEPRTLNRLAASDQATELLTMLTQGRLVRLNRATRALEPWLAERWESSPDGRVHTLHLRKDVVWSDGAPFTSADVLFTLEAVFDPRTKSPLASSLMVAGEPIRAVALDAQTVQVTYAGRSGPGIRLLDNLPIYPKHRLDAARVAGTIAQAWPMTTAPSDMAGTGPFMLRLYQSGQRVILERNPRYWRKAENGTALPYLDRIVLEIVPDQNAELLRVQSGSIDMVQDALRPEDFRSARQAEREGRIKLVELGVATDADAFWFCLKPEIKNKDPRFAFVQKPEFRKAISHAVDREAFSNTVFLGEAVPVWGPITPGNRDWFNPNVTRYLPDLARARELLSSIGLEDRNGNGIREDVRGTEARFTLMTQQGPGWYARGTKVLQEQAGKIGITFNLAPLEPGSMIQRMLACDFDAIYMRPLATHLDPGGNMDFWLSSGSAHFWNLEQKKPATAWEQQIDTLMLQQVATVDPQQRRALFDQVQNILAENLPVLYFAAARMHTAHNVRVGGVQPSVLRPPILWTADTLYVAPSVAKPDQK
jgi:peptide/nickel transport system substrate-binding protein